MKSQMISKTGCFLFLLLILSQCSFQTGTETTPPKESETKILFIGNSLTFWNQMPGIFRILVDSSGREVYVADASKGGYSLQEHCDDPETPDFISQWAWDYIIIQGSSGYVAFPDEHYRLYPCIKKLRDWAKANNTNTQVVFFVDYAQLDSVIYDNQKHSYFEFQELLIKGAVMISDSLDMWAAPVGRAWKQIISDSTDINLYDLDDLHPSPSGSYLQSCVYFCTIFQDSIVRGINFQNIPKTHSTYIEDIAESTVLDSLEHWLIVN